MPRTTRTQVSTLLNTKDEDPTSTVHKAKSSLERRRAVHLRCEHRRRKEIQDALDALANELPPSYKPRSRNAIIVDSAEYIQQLTLSLDCLVQENCQLTGASI